MQRNLTTAVKTVRVANATVAGTSEIDGSAVDLVGLSGGPYTAARAIALLGALTSTQVTKLKIQGSDTNNGSDWADLVNGAGTTLITAAAADADGNKLLICEVYRPGHRYLRAVVTRGTANAVVDGVIMELFLAAFEPVTQDTSVSQYIVQSSSR